MALSGSVFLIISISDFERNQFCKLRFFKTGRFVLTITFSTENKGSDCVANMHASMRVNIFAYYNFPQNASFIQFLCY